MTKMSFNDNGEPGELGCNPAELGQTKNQIEAQCEPVDLDKKPVGSQSKPMRDEMIVTMLSMSIQLRVNVFPPKQEVRPLKKKI